MGWLLWALLALAAAAASEQEHSASVESDVGTRPQVEHDMVGTTPAKTQLPSNATGVSDVLSLETESTLGKPSSQDETNTIGNLTVITEGRNHHVRRKQRRRRLKMAKTYNNSTSIFHSFSSDKQNQTLQIHHAKRGNRINKVATERKWKRRNREEKRKKRLRAKTQDREKRKMRRKNEKLRKKYRRERRKKLTRKVKETPLTQNSSLLEQAYVENKTYISPQVVDKTASSGVADLKSVSLTDRLTDLHQNTDASNETIVIPPDSWRNDSDFLSDDNSLKNENEHVKDYDQSKDNVLFPFASHPLLQQDQLLKTPKVIGSSDGSTDENEHFKNSNNRDAPTFSHTGYSIYQTEKQEIESKTEDNDTSLQYYGNQDKIYVRNTIQPGHKTFLSFDIDANHVTQHLSDLSCINGTFLPAPIIPHSWIKYIRLSSFSVREFLFAEYRCKFGYHLANGSNRKLLCVNRKWVGKVPKCLPDNFIRGNKTICETNKGGCDQICMEKLGKPTCLCFKGFMLSGTMCKDIDECEASNGGCEYKCQNSAGTYRCLCPTGFRLADDQKSCIDVNECLLRNGHGPCQDLCHNEWGGYKCSCDALAGTRLSSDNHTCEDVDECATGVAGCSHGCLNTLGNAFCLCPSGFMLGADWKTCQDINECEEEFIDAEPCDLGCVNTIGSYFCRTKCPSGWEISVKNDKRSCEDVDECTIGTSGCSHVCHNSVGGFECDCHSGYKLAPDNKTCVDGAMRDVCPPLEIPPHGYVECARSSSVEPERRHTRVVNHAGAVCELRCPQGYRKHGEYRRVCGRDREWQGPNSGQCIPWPVPVIQCPKNITYYLDPGRSTAYVEFPKPKTSVDWFRNVESVPEWGKDLEADLPEGYWEVKFIARHPVSHHPSTCTFSINVIKRTFQAVHS